jgi:hypothetical protein
MQIVGEIFFLKARQMTCILLSRKKVHRTGNNKVTKGTPNRENNKTLTRTRLAAG